MPIPRPPGDVTLKTLSRPAKYVYIQDGATLVQGSTPYIYQKDIRPSYHKGAVVTLSAGDTFRKATPYSHESWEVGSFTPATVEGKRFSWQLQGYDEGRDGSLFLSDNPVVLGVAEIPTDMRNESVTKCLNELANQKVNIGENLATAGQTARMFSNKADGLAGLLKAARNDPRIPNRYWEKSFRQLGREGVGNRIARLYLEYVYGFKPLMEDCYVLSQMLKEQANKTLLLSAKGTARRSIEVGQGPLKTSSYSDIRRERGLADARVRTKLYGRISDEWEGLRALNQMGLLNPFALQWELVPFSFVVDWILPIGPVLNAFAAPAGLTFVDGTTALKSNETLTYSYHCDAGNWSVKYLPSTASVVPITYSGYRRVAYNTWPLPGLWVDPDPFRGDRIFKAAALSILLTKDYGKKSPINIGRF